MISGNIARLPIALQWKSMSHLCVIQYLCFLIWIVNEYIEEVLDYCRPYSCVWKWNSVVHIRAVVLHQMYEDILWAKWMNAREWVWREWARDSPKAEASNGMKHWGKYTSKGFYWNESDSTNHSHLQMGRGWIERGV